MGEEEETAPSLPFRMGIIIILIPFVIFILSSFDEDSPIMRAFGFFNMIMFLAGPFILYSILSKNKTD